MANPPFSDEIIMWQARFVGQVGEQHWVRCDSYDPNNRHPELEYRALVVAPPVSAGKDVEAVVDVTQSREPTIHQTIPLLVWADVDIGIADMVRYLNTIPGVRTDASCQGTIGEGGPHPYRPQVLAHWPPEQESRLLAEFDIHETNRGLCWGYLHPRDGWSPQADVSRSVEPVGDGVWKNTVIDACMVNHIGWYEDNPTRTLHDLICYEYSLALDPKVSEAAQELINRGSQSHDALLRQAREALDQFVSNYECNNDIEGLSYDNAKKAIAAIDKELDERSQETAPV